MWARQSWHCLDPRALKLFPYGADSVSLAALCSMVSKWSVQVEEGEVLSASSEQHNSKRETEGLDLGKENRKELSVQESLKKAHAGD